MAKFDTPMSPLGQFLRDLTKGKGGTNTTMVVLDDNAKAILLDSARPAPSKALASSRWESSSSVGDTTNNNSSNSIHRSPVATATVSTTPPSSPVSSPPPPPPPLVMSMQGKHPLHSPHVVISSRKVVGTGPGKGGSTGTSTNSRTSSTRKQRRATLPSSSASSSSRMLPSIPQHSQSPVKAATQFTTFVQCAESSPSLMTSCRWENLTEDSPSSSSPELQSQAPTRRRVSLPPSLPRKELSPIASPAEGIFQRRAVRLPDSLRAPPYAVSSIDLAATEALLQSVSQIYD